MKYCSKCDKEIRLGPFNDATIPSPDDDGTEWHLSCGLDKLDEMRADGSVYWLRKEE